MIGALHTISGIAGAVAGAALTFSVFWGWNTVIDNPRVQKEARLEYVAISELEAEKAKNRLLLKLNAEQAENLRKLNEANANFADQLADAEAEKDSLENELKELSSKAVDPACTVDDSLFDGLRGK